MFFQSWRKTIAFLAILFTTLLLVIWSDLRFDQQPLLTFLQNLSKETLVPVQGKLEQSFIWMRENISAIQELGTLRQELERLKKENDELLKLALHLQEISEENNRLRELLEYKSYRDEYDFVTAQIIGWSPSIWSSRYILNAGANDGLRVDMPAVTSRGVVGRLVQVTDNTSMLMLLQDELSAVGARVQPSGYLGIVRGQGSQMPTLIMTNISLDADIQPGDHVVTSKLSAAFPEGHLIGTVISIEMDASGMHMVATLQMAVDSNRLFEVMIITTDLQAQLEDSVGPDLDTP